MKALILQMKGAINADFATAAPSCGSAASDARVDGHSQPPAVPSPSASADRLGSLEQADVGDDPPTAELKAHENDGGGSTGHGHDASMSAACAEARPSAADAAAESAMQTGVAPAESVETDGDAEDSSDLSLSPTRSALGSARADDPAAPAGS